MNYKYIIYNLSYFILRKYLLVPGLGDIRVKSIKHVHSICSIGMDIGAAFCYDWMPFLTSTTYVGCNIK